jgi:hypothetical protein
MTATLASHGIPPDIIPIHPKMGSLVKAAADLAPEIVSFKHSRRENRRPSAHELIDSGHAS